MSPSRNHLTEAFEQADALLAQAARRAGAGCEDAAFDRQLRVAERTLAARLDRAGQELAAAAFEAARRAMDSAQPEAPLLMLKLARENLLRGVRRHVAQPWLQRAA